MRYAIILILLFLVNWVFNLAVDVLGVVFVGFLILTFILLAIVATYGVYMMIKKREW